MSTSNDDPNHTSQQSPLSESTPSIPPPTLGSPPAKNPTETGTSRRRLATTQLILVGLGYFWILVGIIGAFLPILPTTPFLILAAFCFSKGSPQLHQWLLEHRWFGPPIRDWQTHRVIRRRNKITASILIACGAGFIYSRASIPWIGKLGYTAVVVPVLIFILTRRSERKT